MPTKKNSAAAGANTPETSVSPELKPRARAKSATSKTTAPAAAKPKLTAATRHASVSSRKPVKSAAPVKAASLTEADVATRAYHIWLEQGCPEGSTLSNWLQAEQDLRAMAAGA